ncbi:MAG: DUF4340 domain-containing protein [Xanthomonadales bacterium]|nr:DUF4340 domain-containing protein [Xanthomonadales bacterium]
MVFLLACELQVETNAQTKAGKARFYPDLIVSEIQQIKVAQQGIEPLVTLVLKDARWQLLSPANLPANPALMNALMDSLQNATILEQKTAESDWYKHLGVDDISSAKARGTLLVLEAGEDSIELIIGDKSRNQQGQYWRAANSPNQAVMRVDQVLDLPREAIGWMDREIIDLPANGVASVSIESSDGSHYFLQRNSHEEDLSLGAGKSEGESDVKQLPHSVNQLVFGLTRLNFDAVESLANITHGPAEYTLTFGLFDGTAIKLSLFPDENGSWASLMAINDSQALNTVLVETMNQHLSSYHYHLSTQRTALYIQAIKSLAGEHDE